MWIAVSVKVAPFPDFANAIVTNARMAQQGHVCNLQVRAPWKLRTCQAGNSRCHSSVYIDYTAKICSARKLVRASAGKGFGKTQEAQPSQKPSPKQKKKKSSPKPKPNGPGSSLYAEQLRSKSEDAKAVLPEFDASFENRLKDLKKQGSQKLSEVKQEVSATEANRNIYDNPPPLTQTLFGATKEKKQPDAAGSSTIFNQAALTVGSLLLIGVFLVVSGGSELADLATPRRTAPQSQELSSEQKAEMQKQAERFEGQLRSNAGDVEALEGAGVSYAQLGDFKRAEGLLAKLTNAKPKDGEAWRLLAETRLKLADNKGAAAAFEQSMATAPTIDTLQNLAAAYVNDGKPQAAITAVQAAGQRLANNQAELAELGYGESEISLLLGRVYAQWPGHDSQALDIYDKLIQKNPDDFRGYLARGVLFRGEGRQGDAERMFLQARYIAPKEARVLVDRIIGSS